MLTSEVPSAPIQVRVCGVSAIRPTMVVLPTTSVSDINSSVQPQKKSTAAAGSKNLFILFMLITPYSHAFPALVYEVLEDDLVVVVPVFKENMKLFDITVLGNCSP